MGTCQTLDAVRGQPRRQDDEPGYDEAVDNKERKDATPPSADYFLICFFGRRTITSLSDSPSSRPK